MKEGPGKVMEDQIQGEEDQTMHKKEPTKKGDILQTLHHNLSLSEINALKDVEEICAQNNSLTHEVIVLEEQNHALRRINRNLEYLLKLKDTPTTSSPPSPRMEN